MTESDKSGFFVVKRMTRKVLFADESVMELFPDMRAGAPCYEGRGMPSVCPDCPLDRLNHDAAAYVYRPALGMNVIALRLSGPDSRALVYYGKMSFGERQKWMVSGRYQTILRQNGIIAFEFDPETGEQFLSPFISEYLGGNYDGRRLSQVMLEDQVVHAADAPLLVSFRERLLATQAGETILLRLRTARGSMRWHRVSACAYRDKEQGRTILMGTISDANEEVRLRETFRRRAEFDDITGIYHRAAFYRNVKHVCVQLPWQTRRIMLLDIDRFKMVNEIFGTQEGDRLLKFFAGLLAKAAKPDEFYGRLRDDVFVLCSPRSGTELTELAQTLCRDIRAFRQNFRLSISAGICEMESGVPVNVVCDRAMLALRSVKGSAVQSHAFYEPRMGEAIHKEQEMIGDMHRALACGEFQVWLQPKNDLRNGTMIGAEALIRWIHPQKGMIPPGEFIPIFERNGLVTLLDEYVWRSVCGLLRGWLDMGLDPPQISVNLSRIHLYDPDLVDKLAAVADEYCLSHSLLEIELTESACAKDLGLRDLMKSLQNQGFVLAMDDFGSGYSSLNMLRNIPVDLLKIDLHFLHFSDDDLAGKIILKSVIQMAGELRIPVTVEGVETQAQAVFLEKIGCTRAQGFLFDRPMPAVQFEQKYLPQRGAPARREECGRLEGPTGGMRHEID